MDGPLTVGWKLDHPELRVGVVVAHGVNVGPADAELSAALDEAIATRQQGWPRPETNKAVRDVLRAGGFKPSGRNKPASEYLAGAAVRGVFPRINNLVDINNLVSLETAWPMSILDLERAAGASGGLEIRFGQAGERYVFNSAGQAIELRGLPLVAQAGGQAIGNAVKDAMVAKTDDATRSVVVVLYTSRRVADAAGVLTVLERFGELLKRHAGAAATRVWTLPEE